ncbi:MAG TPA: ADP-ribosylglycohydrolase family protein [Ruminiclostridium sp.]
MLRKQAWIRYFHELEVELLQSADEGKVVESLKEKVDTLNKMEDSNPLKEAMAILIYDDIEKLDIDEKYKYIEPSTFEEIKQERIIANTELTIGNYADNLIYDRIYGAWLGRCSGCLLGKPVEGWILDKITGFLNDTQNYPINYYLSSDVSSEIIKKYDIKNEFPEYDYLCTWINTVDFMPEDDDINYSVLSLKILEKYGKNFTPDDVGEAWLNNLPIFHTFTAERIAYRNLVMGIYPPYSASFRNPYREWIGAQIRSDFYGYISPGNPEQAAEFAWRDASISHTKNGIYGAMFVAAMLAGAYTTDDPEKIVEIGLSQIPSKSRLWEKVKEVMSWKNQGLSWMEARDRIHSLYDEKSRHGYVHTISNAMVVVTSLVYGELDLEKSITIAVMCAFDTDCNGATVGSIVGMSRGAKGLPGKWINPLNDCVKSGVDGFGVVKISELATRTIQILKRLE